MIKDYVNVIPVKAECFDGSFDMVSRYGIISGRFTNGSEFYSINSPVKGNTSVFIGDWIVTSGKGLFWPIPDKTFRKCYVPVKGDYEDE